MKMLVSVIMRETTFVSTTLFPYQYILQHISGYCLPNNRLSCQRHALIPLCQVFLANGVCHKTYEFCGHLPYYLYDEICTSIRSSYVHNTMMVNEAVDKFIDDRPQMDRILNLYPQYISISLTADN